MVNAKISRELKLPALPHTVRECLSYLYSPDADLSVLVTCLQKDVGIVSGILKVANSSLYSKGKTTSDLSVAISRIGFASVMHILVSQSMEKLFFFDPISFFSVKAFLKHAAWVSQIAFELGKFLNVENRYDLLVSGLMHDVGLFIRAFSEKNTMKLLIEKCDKEHLDFSTAEKKLKIDNHAEFGEEVLSKWMFPKEVIVYVKYHHTKEEFRPKNLSMNQNRDINLLILADTLAHQIGHGYQNYFRDTKEIQMGLDKLGVTSEKIEEMIKSLKDQISLY